MQRIFHQGQLFSFSVFQLFFSVLSYPLSVIGGFAASPLRDKLPKFPPSPDPG
jgi:hypothetical protein